MDSFSAHTAAGRAYLAMGDRAAARRHLEQATTMSPNDVVARDLLEKVNLLEVPPTFDPVGQYGMTVAARKGSCGADTTLVIMIHLTKRTDGTYVGTIQIGQDNGKPEPLTRIEMGADRLWLTSASGALRLIVGADGKTIHGRYVEGFGANFPVTGEREDRSARSG